MDTFDHDLSRRLVLGGIAGAAALGATGARAQGPALPRSPITLNVIDVGGALALVQKPLDNFRAAKPNLVSRMTFTKAPAPELPGKIKAMQDARRVDLDLVLGGMDVLSAGIDQQLWVPLLPTYASVLPKPEDIYLKGALDNHNLGQGFGMCMVYYPSGPLLEYLPERVRTPPTSAEELLAWAKANPNRFLYARPANSGPGRTFMMGLPYILGDSDPKDPVNGWSKTWAYLKELGRYIEYYPGGTGATMKELGEGSRDIIVTTTGWDINPRVLGIVPKAARIQTLKGFHWVSDAQFMFVPKGVGDDKLAVLLELIKWVLSPAQQAYTYDEGYFYPGPAVKDVPLSMAPPESQAAIREFGRPEYDKLIAEVPVETPINPDKMVLAFRRWDEEVGSKRA
ncbi:extracellular solute-binding protein [Phreatobacter stygius]|uniref:Extracellular solute-binding protein n=1 Tax=Phreatobacter stygius TaxID=1940610 RepID=A0A4D7B803_9HYPH|nr:extracellular solute-binding protein [Phreatobacter stygius]QCI64077.1 extracellular solute-binding protein [Phreatobacter stygius]